MIDSLPQLAALLKLCRKQGVNEISFGGVSLKLGSLPLKNRRQSDDESDIDVDELTPEELIYMSAGGQLNENQPG